MVVPDPYARTTFHGRPLDNATAAALRLAEAELGYELTVVQGIGGAKASGGTHLEGRAVDLAPWDHARKVRVLQDLGFAAWYRPALPGVWGPHVHAVLIFESRDNRRGLAPAGFNQIGDYDRGGIAGRPGDGLAGVGTDPNTYRPTPRRVFTMDEYRATFEKSKPQPVRNKITRARDRIVEAITALEQAAALLDATQDRPKADAAVPVLRQQARELEHRLDRLPKR